MPILEQCDSEQARRFLLQGLWLQRVLPPTEAGIRSVLEWALEISAAGNPLPPPGLIADVGHLAFGMNSIPSLRHAPVPIPGWDAGLVRTYEDHVLARLDSDTAFERASGPLARYQKRDRARALAFLLDRLRERAGFGGAILSPAVLKSLLQSPPADVLAEGWQMLMSAGLAPLLPQLYDELVGSIRRTAALWGPEDLFELEHGTAVAEFGRRVGLRQVLQAADAMEAALPRFPPRRADRLRETPTGLADEDTYPVGGFAAISTRGTIESLLHSQLAFMEQRERPDLFDIRFLRDELLYYSRDEGEFLRQRRTYLVALFPPLAEARVKDPDLPFQRSVLLLALLLAAVRKLNEWLRRDALQFEFLFVSHPGDEVLGPERRLLETLFADLIKAGNVTIRQVAPDDLQQCCAHAARRSLCHCLLLGGSDERFSPERTLVSRIRLTEPLPAWAIGGEAFGLPSAEISLEAWHKTLETLLQFWM